MAVKFKDTININGQYTLPEQDGTVDQVLSTDGAGVISFVDLPDGEAVKIACKNTTASTITKGTPVYITGTVGASFIVQIAPADAANSAKMPAVGLLETDLAANGQGFIVTGGLLKNLTTDPIDGTTPSSNDTIYVKAGGGLTMTKPTGSNLIQNIGKVGRVNSSNAGSIVVSSILRTNDVPNLTEGKIWVGSVNNTEESTVVHIDETNTRIGINQNTPDVTLDITGTDAIQIPKGTDAERPTPESGMFRFNTTSSEFEGYNGTEWAPVGGANTASIDIDNFTGDGTTVNFTLTSEILEEDNTQVYIDGVYQSKSNYTTSGTTLTFSTAPPTGTSIEVVNFTGIAESQMDGSGTANYVTKWLDSDTLTDSIITDNGSTATVNGAAIVTGDFTVDTNTLYVDSTNDRVGIGTTSPTSKLQSYAVNTVNLGAPANASLSLASDGAINTHNTITFGKQPSGSYAPAYVGYITTDATGNSKGDIIFGARSVTTDSVPTERMRIHSGGDVSFRDTSANEAFYWDASTARLGIGAGSSPSVALHANGFMRSANAGNTVYTEVQNDGVYATGTDLYLLAPATKFISLYAGNSEAMRITSDGLIKIGSPSMVDSGNTNFNLTMPDGIAFGGNVYTYANIFGSSGNITIAANAYPANTGAEATITFKTASSGGGQLTPMVIKGDNVGIGTDSPVSVSGYTTLTLNNATSGGIMYFQQGGVSKGYLYNSFSNMLLGSASGELIFETAGSERMKIHSGGDISFRDTSTNEAFYWDASTARLGIGVGASPAYPLDISGSRIRLKSTTGNAPLLDIESYDTGSFYIGIDNPSNTAFGFGANVRNIYSGGNYDLVISTNSAERMRIDSSGIVTIFTTGGTSEKTYSAAAGLELYSQQSDNGFPYTKTSDIVANGDGTVPSELRMFTKASGSSTPTERVRIDSSGNVGIGVTDPNNYDVSDNPILAVGSTSTAANSSQISILSGSSGYGYLLFADGQTGDETYRGQVRYDHSDDSLQLVTAGSPRMRITSGGDATIGDSSTTNTGKLEFFAGVSSYGGGMNIRHSTTNVNGSGYINFYRNTSVIGSINQVGTTSVAYNTSSDYRLKENVVPMEGALDRVDALKPSRFNFIADADKTVDGFLAHEVAEVVPEAISGEKDAVDEEGNAIYQGIDQSKLVPLLTAALQEAHTLIKDLTARIETLENQ